MSLKQTASQIEIVNPNIPRGHFRHVLFDFDGTISLIREGWQQVMIPMMIELLESLNTGESREQLEHLVLDFVTQTTGKQTIYQMIGLADMIRERGDTPEDPLVYKHEYLRRLMDRIQHRIDALESGKVQPIEMVVPGSYILLEALKRHNVTMYCASGTDEQYVVNEARLLKTDHYFNGGIYGAKDDYKNHSKKIVIERILKTHNLSGDQLLTFGDGFVEIENTKEVGGIAVGVASNEKTGIGIDEWKRERLIAAGADIIVPEFREAELLIAYLYGEVDLP